MSQGRPQRQVAKVNYLALHSGTSESLDNSIDSELDQDNFNFQPVNKDVLVEETPLNTPVVETHVVAETPVEEMDNSLQQELNEAELTAEKKRLEEEEKQLRQEPRHGHRR